MAFTFFFRDIHVLDHVVNHLVPSVMGRSKIKIWDAGCAMGPEPYTLAILLAEKMGNFSFKNINITASDIDENDQFGKIITDGHYPLDELKRIPEDVFARYFNKLENDRYAIDEKIRTRVNFVKHNLLSLQTLGNDYSLILCKNVLLHLQYKERIEVIRMFHKSLAPGGFFATEQTQKMPEEINHLFTQVVPDAQIFIKN